MELKQPDPGYSNGQRNLVTFRLAQQTYALPIEPIVQIIEMVTITPLPQVNSSVEGVINIRGQAVPVVNLRRHFSLPGVPLQLRTPIVLVQTSKWTVGLIVDEVLDVLRLSNGRIRHTADILPEELGDVLFLQGVVQTSNGTVLLLDLEHLFQPHHKEVLAQAMEILPEVPKMIEPASSAPSDEEVEESSVEPPPRRSRSRRRKGSSPRKESAKARAEGQSEAKAEGVAAETPPHEAETENGT